VQSSGVEQDAPSDLHATQVMHSNVHGPAMTHAFGGCPHRSFGGSQGGPASGEGKARLGSSVLMHCPPVPLVDVVVPETLVVPIPPLPDDTDDVEETVVDDTVDVAPVDVDEPEDTEAVVPLVALDAPPMPPSGASS
jgi:hypothetical protein